ncbi:MAG: M28 family peptidase, partial [Chloroflexia bacterium]
MSGWTPAPGGPVFSRRTLLHVGLGALGVGLVAVALPGSSSGLVPVPRDGSDLLPPAFDAERAFGRLLAQLEFGPRVPGSAAHRECRDYLQAELGASLGSAALQPFTLNADGATIPMWNVLADHDPANPRKVLLCAHWDTRPWATEETDVAKQSQPILGANDGASGVAVLLEIAAVLRDSPPP